MRIDELDRLQERTKQFTISVIKLCTRLERMPGLRRVADQLTDAAGSVGSNHRAMRRARSQREFFAKLCIVVEETDESVFWLEVVAGIQDLDGLPAVLDEARQIRAIFAKARSTARQT